jgi:RimJ/RimL family protein N-acetyltransferase
MQCWLNGFYPDADVEELTVWICTKVPSFSGNGIASASLLLLEKVVEDRMRLG